jgi:hypothetical protein
VPQLNAGRSTPAPQLPVHAPAPQVTTAPVHELGFGPHSIAQEASPHPSSMSPQASMPSQEMLHAYIVGQTIVDESQPSVPVQTMLHAYSGGHVIVVSLHCAAGQSMLQTLPAEQPPVQTAGHEASPGGAGSGAHWLRSASVPLPTDASAPLEPDPPHDASTPTAHTKPTPARIAPSSSIVAPPLDRVRSIVLVDGAAGSAGHQLTRDRPRLAVPGTEEPSCIRQPSR